MPYPTQLRRAGRALERQGVAPTRRGKGPIDRVVGDAVVQRIEEPDIFAGAGNIDRYTLESSARAGKVRPVIDDRDHPRGRVIILTAYCLKRCTPASASATPATVRPQARRNHFANVARSVEGEPLPCFTPRLAA